MGEFRLALRGLRKSPVFTIVTLVSLALGIGATTAIFELIDALSLKPLEVARPGELAVVKIRNMSRFKGRSGGTTTMLSYPVWERIRDRQEAFSSVGAFKTECDANLAPAGVMHPITGLCVSGGYYGTLGLAPFLGRLIGPDDDVRGCTARVAVVSHAFWQRELGGDRAALGRKISLDGRPFEVIGVTPPGFGGPEAGRSFDVTTPMCLDAQKDDSYLTKSWWLSLAVIGRLKPGWTIERASAQLEAISPAIMEETVPPPPFYDAEMNAAFRAYRLAAEPASTGISGLRAEYARPLDFLLGIAALVLLIACANLANLLLARAATREREMAVRLAVGASRWRLARQLLGESLLLALLGAALGLALSRFLADLILTLLPDPEHVVVDVGMDWRVFGFAAGLAVVTCVLFGLAPALRGARTDVGLVLKATANSVTDGPRRFGLRRLLVAAQVALSFVLVIGALLFVRSLQKLVDIDPGFRGAHVARVSIELDPTGNGAAAARWAPVQDQILTRLRDLPGVETAAFAGLQQLEGSGWATQVWPDGAEGVKSSSQLDRVGSGYFATIGIPLLAGRDFAPADGPGAPAVAIVNTRFARTFFGDENPLGKRFRVSAGAKDAAPRAFEIVGVVADSKYRSLREDLRPTAYFTTAQDNERGSGIDLYVRSRLTLPQLTTAAEKIALDASATATLSVTAFDQYRHDSLARDRMLATVAGLFGALAALLAAAGLYGVFAYSVARRGRELGIRMALGASGGRVARLIFGEAAWLLALGLGAGIALAAAGGRVATSLVYGLSPRDPITYIAAALLLGVLAALAVLPAALRAARVDPMKTLRQE